MNEYKLKSTSNLSFLCMYTTQLMESVTCRFAVTVTTHRQVIIAETGVSPLGALLNMQRTWGLLRVDAVYMLTHTPYYV